MLNAFTSDRNTEPFGEFVNKHVDLAEECTRNLVMGLRAFCQSAICSDAGRSLQVWVRLNALELRVRPGFLGDAMRIDNVALALVSASSISSGAVKAYVTDIEAIVNEEP